MSIKKCSEIIISLVLIAAGIVLRVSAQYIEVGAAMGKGGDFLPKLCSNIWLLLSILLLVSSVSGPDDGEKKISISLKGFFATLGLLFFYVLLLKPLGFVVTSIIYMFVQMLLFVPKENKGKRTVILFAVTAVVMPVLVYLLFANVFSLILPTGILADVL